MKKQSLLAAAAVAALALPATAGQKDLNSNVLVNVAGRYASGSLGVAHNSSSNYEYIYCYVTGYETFTALSCAAVNQANQFAACNVTNPPQSMLNALATASPESNISFTWNSSYKCTNITVWSSSMSVPKIPPPPPLVLVGGVH